MGYPVMTKILKKYYTAYLPTLASGTQATIPIHARCRPVTVQMAPAGTNSQSGGTLSVSWNGSTVTYFSTATSISTGALGTQIVNVDNTEPFWFANGGDTIDVTIGTSGSTCAATVTLAIVEV